MLTYSVHAFAEKVALINPAEIQSDGRAERSNFDD